MLRPESNGRCYLTKIDRVALSIAGLLEEILQSASQMGMLEMMSLFAYGNPSNEDVRVG